MNRLNISHKIIATPDDIEKWPHLNGVELPSIDKKEARLLIGTDVPEMFWVLEERRGNKGEPCAIRSPLGWTLMGPTQFIKDDEDQFNINLT